MRRLALVLLSGVACFFVACQSNKLKIDVSNINVEINIDRFERDLFNLNGENTLTQLKKDYPRILNLYSQKVIGLGNVKDLNYPEYLNKFLKDSIMNLAINRIDSIFPDLDDQESELTEGFKHLKYYYPNVKIPRLFSQLSGFNQSIVVDEGMIGVSLDKYLGEDCEFYALLRRPIYMRENMKPSRIAQDILLAYGLTEFPFKPKTQNLMEQMVYQGKILYFLQALMPDKSESDIMKYRTDKYQWCVDNESQMWAYLIEKKHLFNTNTSMARNYINDAPFTTGMPQVSPGRIGTWLGLQIIKSYMEKHSDVSLPVLMANNDYAGILRESAYQP